MNRKGFTLIELLIVVAIIGILAAVGAVVIPNVLGNTKKSLGQRGELRKRFWTSLLHESKNHTKLFSNISPGQYGWIGRSAGKRGLSYVFVVLQHSAWVEFYIEVLEGFQYSQENTDGYHSIFLDFYCLSVYIQFLIWHLFFQRKNDL